MDDDQLHKELLHLGVDAKSYRAVMLLPLVQVAWADGQVRDKERDLILTIAQEKRLLEGTGGTLLLNWLRSRPTEAQFQRARRVLVELARRTQGIGSDVGPNDLAEICTLCESVATSAGGLFGVAFTVSSEERAAITEIVDGLRWDRGTSTEPREDTP